MPIHGDGCEKRIKRGLFKCERLKKAFNADLAAVYNILITPSHEMERGNGPRVTKKMTSLAPSRGGVKALKSLNTLKYYRIQNISSGER
jgi:transposase